jgi:outer membrane protein assembly factor BamB
VLFLSWSHYVHEKGEQLKRTVSGILFVLLLVSIFTAAFNVQPVKVSGTIYVRADDSMSSPTAPTQRNSEAVMHDTVDWWNMSGHDPSHTRYSTSSAVKTNNTIWKYQTNDSVESSPAVTGGMVYVGSMDNSIYCLNASSGALVWSYKTHGIVESSPAVVGGRVYVGSDDNRTYCLNAATGAQVWNYTTGGSVESSPVVANGSVYVGSDDNHTYCLNAATGAQVWNYTTHNWVFSSPAVVGGLVYVSSLDGYVYCLNASSGHFVWDRLLGTTVASSPMVVDGKVYVGSIPENVYCLNASARSGGKILWTYPTDSYVFSSAAVAYGKVYVGLGDNSIYCLNASTGNYIWNYSTHGPVMSSPAVAGGLVYVSSTDNSIYCLNASSGALVWSYKTDAAVESSPAVANGVVYVGSDDNKIYAFGPPPTIHISPSSFAMDVGQSLTFNSSASGGIPPYKYHWYRNHTLVATGSSWTFTPTAAGSYSVYVNVTDNASVPVTVKSNTASVTVHPALSVSILPATVVMDVGQSQLFNSSVVGGTAKHSYKWYLDGGPVFVATSASWTFTPTAAGSYSVYVNVTDNASSPMTVKSNTASVTVHAALSVSISPPSVVIDVNQSRTFTSVTNGTGTPPYTYQWYLNNKRYSGATSSSWTIDRSIAPGGFYRVYVNVTDNASNAMNAASNTATVISIIHGHDVAIINVTPSKTFVGQNFTDSINVTVVNLGNYTEPFNVTTSIHMPGSSKTQLYTYTGMLSSGSNTSARYTTITFTWDTTGFAYGNYTISASVTLATGEANNWTGPFTYGRVKVTIPGDANGDGTVDAQDFFILERAWDTSIGQPNYNPYADFNSDGVVDAQDFYILEYHWDMSLGYDP